MINNNGVVLRYFVLLSDMIKGLVAAVPSPELERYQSVGRSKVMTSMEKNMEEI